MSFRESRKPGFLNPEPCSRIIPHFWLYVFVLSLISLKGSVLQASKLKHSVQVLNVGLMYHKMLELRPPYTFRFVNLSRRVVHITWWRVSYLFSLSQNKNHKLLQLTTSAILSKPGTVLQYPVLRMIAEVVVEVVVRVTVTVWDICNQQTYDNNYCATQQKFKGLAS